MTGTATAAESQSPDGDFFDPEVADEFPADHRTSSHSPLTGIFLIRRRRPVWGTNAVCESQSPDGDFFDPENAHGRGNRRRVRYVTVP